MGPVALLVFKTSAPANNGLVSSTLTRLRHPLGNSVKMEAVPVFTIGSKRKSPAPSGTP